MKLKFVIFFSFVLYSNLVFSYDNDELFNIVNKQNLEESTSDIRRSIGKGIWSPNRKIFIAAIPKLDRVFVYGIIVNDSGYHFVNASHIGRMEFSWAGDIDPGRVEVTILSIDENADHFYLKVRKRAWINGQRYTKVRPLVIRRDGIVVHQ